MNGLFDRKRMTTIAAGAFLLLFVVFAVILLNRNGGLFRKKPKVQLSVWGSEMEQELLTTLSEEFIAMHRNEADIEITVSEEKEGTCRSTVMFCPEAAADVFFFPDDQFHTLYDSGTLKEIVLAPDEVTASVGGKESAAFQASSIDDRLYALPCTASNGYFLYYDSRYFAKGDVENLERILEVARENGKKFGVEITSGWYLYGFFKAAGMDVHIAEDGTGNDCDWNRTSGNFTGTDVLEALIRISRDPGFTNVGNDAFLEGIQNGSIIAGISGTWNAAKIEEIFGEGYSASKLPQYTVKDIPLQIHSVAGFKLVGVNAWSREPEWAEKLAMWYTEEENQRRRFDARKEAPANVTAAQTPAVKAYPAISALTAQNLYGHLQYVDSCYWDAAYKLGNIIAAGNNEDRDLQEVLDEFCRAAAGEQ